MGKKVPRPAQTYRAARRNEWRAKAHARPWLMFRRSHPAVSYMPAQPSGWDWRNGGRLQREIARTGWWAWIS